MKMGKDRNWVRVKLCSHYKTRNVSKKGHISVFEKVFFFSITRACSSNHSNCFNRMKARTKPDTRFALKIVVINHSKPFVLRWPAALSASYMETADGFCFLEY